MAKFGLAYLKFWAGAGPGSSLSKIKRTSSRQPESECAQKIMSKAGIPPPEQALANFLIRQKLFSNFLNPTCLLNCRLVCKEWEAEASWTLQHKNFRSKHLRVTFRYSYELQTFVSFNENRTQRTIREFLEDRDGPAQNFDENNDASSNRQMGSKFLQECCTFFAFHGGNVGEEPGAIAFFTNRQSNIRGLFLRFLYDYRPGLRLDGLMNLLLRCRKSLKYLHIKWRPHPWDSRYDRLALADIGQTLESYSDLGVLPALEVLKMTSVFCYLNIDLLLWSPSLRQYIDNSAWNLEEIHKWGQMDKVTTWFFSFYPNVASNNVTRLCQLPTESLPRLKKFGWDPQELDRRRRKHNNFEVEGLVTRILDRSQKSLVKVWNVLDFFRCPGIVLPRLENVRHVTQYRRKPEENLDPDPALGSTLLDLSKLVPNVEHFELNHFPDNTGPHPEEMALIDDFDDCLPLTSVSKVTFWFKEAQAQSLTIERVQKIKRLCPNIKALVFSLNGVPEELPELFLMVWRNFEKISHLSFQFRSDEPCRTYMRPNADQDETPDFLSDQIWRDRLDSAITGLDLKTCQDYRRDCKGQIEVGRKNEPEVYVETGSKNQPNILNMKKLEYLEIKIGPFSSPYSLFSPISFRYGFEAMKIQQDFLYKFPPQLIL